MLYKETVTEPTLELLKRLMQDEVFKDFFLVGGTALSLQIGHRISDDIDLFTTQEFNDDNIFSVLEKHYQFQLYSQEKNTLKGEINKIKSDFISHAYPVVKPLVVSEGIRMASLHDIAAMKLNAISGNGTRVKDFIDIAYLSSFISFSEMIDAYNTKYILRNKLMPIKAVNYYNDIDFTEKIKVLNKDYSWKIISARLDKITTEPQKIFPAL